MNNAEPLSADERLALLAELDADAFAGLDADADDTHPLSDAQYRLWFADSAEGRNVLFNFATALSFDVLVEADLLVRAFQTVARRHRVLTATVIEVDGLPRQRFDADFIARVPAVDLGDLPAPLREEEQQRLTAQESGRVFELARGPLFHVLQLRRGEAGCTLLMSMHHIVSDGWSSAIFIRELTACFLAEAQGVAPVLPALEIQYSDYAYWQRERLAGDALAASLAYWKQQLAQLPTLRLPLDRPRPARRSPHGDAVRRALPAPLATRLRALAQAHSVTPFVVLLAAFKLLLARYHGGEDIAVGSSVSSRPLPELEQLIGLFVNQLVLRTRLDGEASFAELLQRVSRTSVDALAHQEIPFDRVVAEVAAPREPGLSPLFQVLFVLNNQPRQAIAGPGGLGVRAEPIASRAARFDLSLIVDEQDYGFALEWSYRSDIFDRSTIALMADRYEAVLQRALDDPQAAVAAIDMLTDTEKQAKATEMLKRQESRADRFKGARRKSIDLGSLKLVEEGRLGDGEGYPPVFTPAAAGVDLAEWAEGQRDYIEQRLHEHGALLFRGFGTDSVDKFERFARAVCPDLVGDYGDLPKESKGEKVYKSTPYPEDKAILFHNESSHTHRWPMKQFFSCQLVAEQGGETPIVDCRRLYRQLSPAVAARLTEHGLLYLRNFIEGLDVAWQDFFKTDDKAEVEAHLTRLGTEFAWTGENSLRLRQRARAIARHPRTGELVFFNQIQLHHIGCMEPHERESLLALFAENELPRNVYYGDGSPIEPEVIAEIDRLYRDNTISFPWLSGDILMVDNMLTAHGRFPFKGPRKVIVAMGEMVQATDVPEVRLDPAA